MKSIAFLFPIFLLLVGCFAGPGDWYIYVEAKPVLDQETDGRVFVTFVDCSGNSLDTESWPNGTDEDVTLAQLKNGYQDRVVVAIPHAEQTVRLKVFAEGFDPYLSNCEDFWKKAGRTVNLGEIRLHQNVSHER